MTLWHHLESLSPFARRKGWLCWENGLARRLRCPACHATAKMQTRLSVASPFVRHRRFRLYECPQCASMHCPDLHAPAYEDQTLGDLKQGFEASKKFYVEQGAGLESMIAPFCQIREAGIKSLLEVGCGYGFSLDFAKRALGWAVLGMDPSPIARAGATELGVPINGDYLGESAKLDGQPFDLVFSSEVIEHIADPDPFVRALARAAGKNGMVMLTTPDVAGLKQHRALEDVLALASPGWHLVLFSKDGLTACLRRAGLAHIAVHSEGDTLHALAAMAPLPASLSSSVARSVDRGLLGRYLQGGLRRKTLPAHLFNGFAGRLLRLQTDAGDYQAAAKTWDRLARRWRAWYGIDLDRPDTLETGAEVATDFAAYSRSRPFNLPSVLYCGGMVALNGETDQPLAQARFAACVRSHEVMEPLLRAINATDLQSRRLAQDARALLAALIAQHDPARAVALFENLERSGAQIREELYDRTRLQVFSAAANSGDYGSAARLRRDVENALADSACLDVYGRAAAMGLAMLALNHDFDRKTALFWLQKVLEDAPDEPLYADMRDVWARHASARGIELLSQGGPRALAAQRDHIGAALRNAKLASHDFPVLEALGLAYAADAPDQALFWFEKALPLASAAQRASTQARLREASASVFAGAVNRGDHALAAKTRNAAVAQAQATAAPGLCFALGLDALNRLGDLETARDWFEKAAGQSEEPELAVHGAFHLALVLARTGEGVKARKVANALYAPSHPQAELVKQAVGMRAAELDAAIASAA